MPHEPLFARLESAGFDRHACNLPAEPTHRIRSEPGSRRGTLKLDWIFTRGLAACEPELIDAIDPRSGDALSDHEILAVTIRPA